MQEGFQAINSALSNVDRKRVKGIGISGQQHGFVPVDKKGEARFQVLQKHPQRLSQNSKDQAGRIVHAAVLHIGGLSRCRRVSMLKSTALFSSKPI